MIEEKHDDAPWAWKKLALLGTIVVSFAVLMFFFRDQITLDALKAKQVELAAYTQNNLAVVLVAFIAIYILFTALSLPMAAVLTLAAGALFGTWVGTAAVSVASTTGATLAMLSSRYILRDWVEKKFGEKLKKFDEGVEREGAFYLLALRLVPAFPFFLVNLGMGLTKIKVGIYFFVSQVGMLAGTFVYVNAGTELSKIDSLKGLLSPGLIASFAALGVLPLILKKIVAYLRRRRAGADADLQTVNGD